MAVELRRKDAKPVTIVRDWVSTFGAVTPSDISNETPVQHHDIPRCVFGDQSKYLKPKHQQSNDQKQVIKFRFEPKKSQRIHVCRSVHLQPLF